MELTEKERLWLEIKSLQEQVKDLQEKQVGIDKARALEKNEVEE